MYVPVYHSQDSHHWRRGLCRQLDVPAGYSQIQWMGLSVVQHLDRKDAPVVPPPRKAVGSFFWLGFGMVQRCPLGVVKFLEKTCHWTELYVVPKASSLQWISVSQLSQLWKVLDVNALHVDGMIGNVM